jgi:hypothetical protein
MRQFYRHKPVFRGKVDKLEYAKSNIFEKELKEEKENKESNE